MIEEMMTVAGAILQRSASHMELVRMVIKAIELVNMCAREHGAGESFDLLTKVKWKST